MLKVLWLAPFPYDSLCGESSTKNHPAPWVTELAKGISNKVELTIANWSSNVNGVKEFDKNGIKYIFAKKPRVRFDLLTNYRLRIHYLSKHLKKFKYDLVHVHGAEHQYEIVAEKLRIPYVISIQGILNLYKKYYDDKFTDTYLRWSLGSIYERSGIIRGKYFFCRTKFDSGYVRNLNHDANIIHNWEIIREAFFENNYNENCMNLLFLGGARYFKGAREALRCFDLLKKRGYDVKLRLCGPGNVEKLEEFIKVNDLTIAPKDIEFVGYLRMEQLVKIFKDSFCLIHPSYMDNSPNSVCEAQVSGLPVIASDVGGVGSLVENGVTGLLVKRYDHFGLADQVCRLLNDKNFYRRLSENSKKVARKRHDRKKIIETTLKTYCEMVR